MTCCFLKVTLAILGSWSVSWCWFWCLSYCL